MSIQEILIPNNQKKKIIQAVNDENIIFKDDNGDVVLNVQSYIHYKEELQLNPIEDILIDELMDFKHQYIVFS